MTSEFLRILIALLLLHMSRFGHTPLRLVLRTGPTATVTATAQPSDPPAPTATTTASPTAPFTPTATPSFTAPATSTATWTATWTPTATNTPRPTATATSTAVPTATSGQSSDPTGSQVTGVPPAQKLPSAVLVYPLVRTSATQDTRIEMLNLTSSSVTVDCFYVSSGTCNEIGYTVRLTANQPASWLASTGANGNGTRLAPPFTGDGELKCVVVPPFGFADLNSYNALQGRALVSDSSGQIIGYSAVAFRRLSAGSFTGQISLDGVTYEQCPDRLHFHVLTNQATSNSEFVLIPCSEDLENQLPSGANVQLSVINELEQRFSGATHITCFNRFSFSSISALRQSSVGTDTAHVIVRGTDVPLIGLVIDRFTTPGGKASASSNDPYLEGGRSATIYLP
jgi:hypothetical protein